MGAHCRLFRRRDGGGNGAVQAGAHHRAARNEQVCWRPRRKAARSAPPPRRRTHLQPCRSVRMLAPVARTTVAHGWCAYGSTRARAEWGDARICVGDAPRRGTRRAHTWVLPSDTTPPNCAQVRRVPDGDGRHAAGLRAVRDGVRPPAATRLSALPNRDSLLLAGTPGVPPRHPRESVGLRRRDSVGSLGSLP